MCGFLEFVAGLALKEIDEDHELIVFCCSKYYNGH